MLPMLVTVTYLLNCNFLPNAWCVPQALASGEKSHHPVFSMKNLSWIIWLVVSTPWKILVNNTKSSSLMWKSTVYRNTRTSQCGKPNAVNPDWWWFIVSHQNAVCLVVNIPPIPPTLAPHATARAACAARILRNSCANRISVASFLLNESCWHKGSVFAKKIWSLTI